MTERQNVVFLLLILAGLFVTLIIASQGDGPNYRVQHPEGTTVTVEGK